MKLSKKLLSGSLILAVAGMVLLFQPLTFAVKRGDEVLNYSQSTEAVFVK